MDNGSRAETEAYFRERLRVLCLEYDEQISLIRMVLLLEERLELLRDAFLRKAETERTR